MKQTDLWQNVLGEIELQISRPNFLTWLKNSELVEKDEEEGKVLVGLPNNFAKEWVKNRYHKLILGSLRNFDGSVRSVSYTVISRVAPSVKKRGRSDEPPISFDQLPLSKTSVNSKTNLSSKYSFSSFIVGSSNELAHAAARAVIENIGKKYNPLFIYGGVGLGKTHLIQATGNEIYKKYNKKLNVLYVTSEKFINDVVWAIRNKRTEGIKRKYRDVDVLIIDDIQFIGGKPATELEFFYTFNALYENNKQIILSSDRPPAAIPTLEERLRSRFEGGMITDISCPDYEMRVAILKTKIQEQRVDVDKEIINHIATKVQKNIRELTGVLNKVVFYQQYKNIKIDKKELDKIIQETTRVSPKNITITDIIKAVTDFYEVSPLDIKNKGRKHGIVEPRQIIMYLLREILKLSYPHIGEKLGKRDHTTVIHAYDKISKEIEKNASFNQKILLIKEHIYKT